jgi:hypothetical protein
LRGDRGRCVGCYYVILRRTGDSCNASVEPGSPDLEHVRINVRRLQINRGRRGLDQTHAAPVELPESLAWEGFASTAHLSLRDLHSDFSILKN